MPSKANIFSSRFSINEITLNPIPKRLAKGNASINTVRAPPMKIIKIDNKIDSLANTLSLNVAPDKATVAIAGKATKIEITSDVFPALRDFIFSPSN